MKIYFAFEVKFADRLICDKVPFERITSLLYKQFQIAKENSKESRKDDDPQNDCPEFNRRPKGEEEDNEFRRRPRDSPPRRERSPRRDRGSPRRDRDDRRNRDDRRDDRSRSVLIFLRKFKLILKDVICFDRQTKSLTPRLLGN